MVSDYGIFNVFLLLPLNICLQTKVFNKINGTNCLAPDAHFDNTCLFSDARDQNI